MRCRFAELERSTNRARQGQHDFDVVPLRRLAGGNMIPGQGHGDTAHGGRVSGRDRGPRAGSAGGVDREGDQRHRSGAGGRGPVPMNRRVRATAYL